MVKKTETNLPKLVTSRAFSCCRGSRCRSPILNDIKFFKIHSCQTLSSISCILHTLFLKFKVEKSWVEVGTKKYIPFKLYVGKNDLCDDLVKRSPKKKFTETFFTFEEKITKNVRKKVCHSRFLLQKLLL